MSTVLLLIVLLCVASNIGYAQGSTSPNRGFTPAGSYTISDIEAVDNYSGNVSLNIPLASLPAGRGGKSGGSVGLVYNSKLYETLSYPDYPGGPRQYLQPSPEGGWRWNFNYQLKVEDRYHNVVLDEYPQCPALEATDKVAVSMIFPDGSEHPFQIQGYAGYGGYDKIVPNGYVYTCSSPYYYWVYNTLTYYSTDGTYLRLDVYHDNESPNWEDNPWTLYFPDGRKITFNEPGAGNGVQRFYDRNNNYIEARSITWNGEPASQIIDQFNRSIIIQYDSITGNTNVYEDGTGGVQLQTVVKWTISNVVKTYDPTDTFNPAQYVTGIWSFSSVQEIVLPAQAGQLSYTFTYNGNGSYPTHSTGYGEISSITLPTGAKGAYQYWGDNVDNSIPTYILKNYVATRTLSYRSEYDGQFGESAPLVSEQWTYNPGNDDFISTVTAPDGGITRNYHDSGASFPQMSYKTEQPDGVVVERIWQKNLPNGWAAPPVGSPVVNPYVKTEYRSIKNGSGTLSQTAIKDYSYDKNGNITQVVEYDWVPYSAVTRGGVYNLPTGIPGSAVVKRVTFNTYYNPTPDASDSTTNDPDVYHKSSSQSLKSAMESSEIRSSTSSGSALSRTEFFYDNYSTTGNLTTEKSWDSTKGAITRPLTSGNSISVTHQYDAYGNRTLTTDARGYQTQFIYDPINGYSNLYPTQTKTAYGTTVQRHSTQQYDFYTGLVTQSTDVDNNVITKTTYDVFGRPTLVEEADGTTKERRTATEYSDTMRRVITRSDLNTTGDGKIVSIQHYDQLGRIRLSRSLEDSATQDPYNEQHGIKVQTRYAYSGSNSYEVMSAPFRASTSGGAGGEAEMAWKRTKFDQGGKVLEVETFAGATLPSPWSTNTTSTGKVTTAYDAEFTTVTDQINKPRRSMVDGLGRLVRVDEPDKDTGSLGITSSPVQPTSYTYNALGNLTQIVQGAQTRTYVYSSLRRLTSATSPEHGAVSNGTVTYAYDNNGNLTSKTDARGVTATYTYDALNRNTSIGYSDGSTPVVERYYDGAVKGKGRLWYSLSYNLHPTSGQLAYSFTITDSYDELGRPLAGSQQLYNGSQWKIYPVSRTYDIAGNVKTQTYPSGRTVTYNYDNASRLSSFTGAIGDGVSRTYADTFTYNAFGQIKKERFGTTTALYHNIHYNSRAQAVDIRLGTSSTDEWNWNRGALITYFSNQARSYGSPFLNANDNNGSVTMQEHYVPTDDAISSYAITLRDTYEYDYLNRLKQVSGNQRTTAGAWISIYGQGFIYDRWGNRRIDPNTGVTWGNAITNAFFTIDPANNNRLVGLGYDNAGNVTNDTITGSGARTYDAENRMKSAQVSGGTSYYVYDADGKRVRRITGGVETWHIYGFGGELIAEYPANGATGSPSKEYGYRGGQLLIVGDSTNVRWTVTDALGTPRIVAGKTGALSDVTRHDYLPFGEELYVGMGTGSIRATTMGYGTGGTNDGIRKKFTGYERDDETGMDFAQARYYSSRQGRFTSPDEFTGGPDELFDFADIASENPTFYADLTEPQSLNKYQYCYNNPLSNVDPDGHSVWSKAIKFAIKVYKKGDAVAAAVETAEDAFTVADSSKSKGERAFAAVSLISELSPVSISDVRDVYRWLRPAAKKLDNAGSIRNVNPGFPDTGRTTNCVNCAIATDATLKGNPASALPGGVTSISVLEKTFGGTFQAVKSKGAIEKTLLAAGNGATGIVYAQIKGQRVGHVFNVVNQKGTIRFLDGQTGKAVDDFSKLSNLKLLRTN
jgi:RHS repeat-associated protein